MSDTKISEAVERLERAYVAGMDEEFRDDLRVVLDALTQPAELAEQKGVELPPLPRMQEFTSLYGRVSAFGSDQMREYARAALTATGKQQVGEASYHPAQRQADIEGRIEPSARELEGLHDEQVGEVQEPFCYLGEYDANYIERNRPGQAQCVLFKGRHPKKSVPLFRAPAQGIDLGQFPNVMVADSHAVEVRTNATDVVVTINGHHELIDMHSAEALLALMETAVMGLAE